MTALPPEVSALLDKAPRHIKREFARWLDAVTAWLAAPRGDKLRTARVHARRLGVSVHTVEAKAGQYRQIGPIAIVDKRWSASAWNRTKPVAPKEDSVRDVRARNVVGEWTVRLYKSGELRVVKRRKGQLRP